MKRIFAILLAVMFAGQAWTQTTFEIGNLKYTVTDGTNVSVKAASNNITEANIPSEVTYPETDGTTYTVTSIGNSAFSGCRGLTTITIPNSVTSIGKGAFSGCSSLQSITLPFVGDKAHTPDDTDQYPFGYIFGESSYKGGTATSQYAPDISSTAITTYYIPTSLKEVIITGSEHITKGAFVNCTNLTSVTIPNTVTSIDQEAFAGCSGLTSITIPNSVISIGKEAFTACSGMKSVTIGNSVTSIGQSAFFSCSSLESVTIPNSVTSIGDYAFQGCRGLTSVTIGNYVTCIGYRAFGDCSRLTSLTIPNSVTSIGSFAFSNCSGLTTVAIGNSVTSIGDYTFEWCSSLTSVTIGNSVTSIGGYVFYGCSGLTEVTIPESVTSIGDYAFYDCIGLKSVTIPNSVTSIGFAAFYNCRALKSVTIPNSVKSIGIAAFSECIGLTEINVEPNNTKYESENGVLFNKEKTELIYYPAGKTETTYTIPNSVTSIGKYAFDGCSKLTAVTISNTVTSIGESAFNNCSGLTEVTIGNSVTSIGNYAFYNCRALTSICYEGSSEPTYQSNSFNNVDKTIPVCVPADYSSDSWCGFTNLYKGHDIVIDPATVTCTEAGLTEGSHCSKCGKILVVQQEVAALGHDWSMPTYTWAEDGRAWAATAVCQRDENHTATENVTTTSEVTTTATCEEDGITTYTAAFENEPFTTQTKEAVNIPATGHSYSTAVTDPTCTAVGYTTHTCSVCEYTYNSDTIAASGHTEVIDAAVAATCTTAGKTEGKHCSVCDAVLVAQEKVAALGHKFEKYTYNNDATTAADGTETSTCERGCGVTDTRVAAGTKLAETPEKGTAVAESAANVVTIYAHHNIIVVENATDEISIYNAMGTLVCRNATPCVRTEILITAPGIYIVKVGGTAKRVMVE